MPKSVLPVSLFLASVLVSGTIIHLLSGKIEVPAEESARLANEYLNRKFGTRDVVYVTPTQKTW